MVGLRLVLMLAISCLGVERIARGEGLAPRVLVLHSQRSELPITEQWQRSIREGIETNFAGPVAIDSEYLDFHRLEKRADQEEMLRLILSKYESIPPDVVIPVHDGVAALFVRQNPFPRAKLVFCSILERTHAQIPPSESTTGVLYRFTPRRTLQGARRLFPQVREVVVISGSGAADQALLDATRADLALEPEWKVDYWTGVPVGELCERVAELPADRVVLFNSYMRHAEGEIATTPRDVAQRVAQASHVPVFAQYDTLLGTGIVGGCLVPVAEQGRLAGELTARILRGETPGAIPFAGTEMNRFVFDAQALHRWGVREADIPFGSVVKFTSPNLWDEYRAYVVSGIAVVALQSLLIATLLVQRRRRMRAETALRETQRQAEQLAGRILTAQEDERKRIARELHDDISQRLAVCAIAAGKVELNGETPPSARAGFAELKTHLSDLAEDVHRLSRQLHPSILDDFGLRDALRAECDRVSARGGPVVRFGCGPLPEALPKELALCVYRVAQEALNNAVKHSHSDRIELTVNADLEFIDLEVRDFGCGFDPAAVRPGGGLGLASMEERVRLVGGELTVDAPPGGGARLQVHLPLRIEA